MPAMSHKPLSIIRANPINKREIPEGNFLKVSEFFCDTIQGENFVGWPAAFLRLQDCTMNCVWCDTRSVWRYGNPYSFQELFDLMELANLHTKFQRGQHLVLTGGSPLKQQMDLIEFLELYSAIYDFLPYIEVENECCIMPHSDFIPLVKCWNNSPKLSNSGNARELRYQPEILRTMSRLQNSWFKFVIEAEEDWQEIQMDFLDTGLIAIDQVVLMPMGGNRQELEHNREVVLSIAVSHNVRYSTREHVVIWDKATGV